MAERTPTDKQTPADLARSQEQRPRPEGSKRLVIRRKPLQSIWIGDDVLVTVLDIERGRVKLSVEAPANVHIARDEIAGKEPSKKPSQ